MLESDEEAEGELEDDMIKLVLGLLRRVWCSFLLPLVVRPLNLRRGGCLSRDELGLLMLELEEVERLNLLSAPDQTCAGPAMMSSVHRSAALSCGRIN